MQKIISIITVTKNDINRLKITINSLNNFYDDDRYEHIIIDGGSSDGTVSYLESLKNVNFRSYVDNGLYDAMNAGIALSKGKFLNFLNCGDLLVTTPDDLIQCINPYLKNPQVDILCFSFEEEFDSVVKWRTIGKVTTSALPCSHQAMLFSDRYIKRNTYNIKYKIASDYDLYSRASTSRVVVVKNFGPLVRVEGYGFASSNPITSYQEYLDIAGNNFKGLQRILVLLKIAARAIVVIPIKLLVNNSTYNFLKKKFG